MPHRVVVLAEADDLGVVPESLPQGQLGDGLHGQAQQVGTQRGVLGLGERPPLPHQLLHQLREREYSLGLATLLLILDQGRSKYKMK